MQKASFKKQKACSNFFKFPLNPNTGVSIEIQLCFEASGMMNSSTMNNKQCPSLNRITLGRHKSDQDNRMIQLTDVFCVLLIDNGASNI
jgi:hypothetical protein